MSIAPFSPFESQPHHMPGTWKPLEATEFEGLAKGVEALQFLQRAQQIGKAGRGVETVLKQQDMVNLVKLWRCLFFLGYPPQFRAILI